MEGDFFQGQEVPLNIGDLGVRNAGDSADMRRMQILDSLAAGLSGEVGLRFACCFVSAFFLGVERETHGRAAGLRTLLLVSLSACAAMALSGHFYEAYQPSGGGWRPDPARLAAGVLSGMGFIGAGVIIRQQNHMIRGVTTAATLWMATLSGLCFGSGLIGLGFLVNCLGFVILTFGPILEARIQNDWYATVVVRSQTSGAPVEVVESALGAIHLQVKGLELSEDLAKEERTTTLRLKFKKDARLSAPALAVRQLRELPGVLAVSWNE